MINNEKFISKILNIIYNKTYLKKDCMYFKKFEYFKNIEDKILKLFISKLEVIKVLKHSIIYEHEDISNFVYFVLDGELEMFDKLDKINLNRKNRKNNVLNTQFTNSFRYLNKNKPNIFCQTLNFPKIKLKKIIKKFQNFGDLEIINNSKRNNIIISSMNSILLIIKAQDFLDILNVYLLFY